MYQNIDQPTGYDLPGHAGSGPAAFRSVPPTRISSAAWIPAESPTVRLAIGLAIALAIMSVSVVALGLRQHSLEVAITRQKADADAAARQKADDDRRAAVAQAEEAARQEKERAEREAQRERESQLSEMESRMTSLQTSLDTVTAESADYDTKVVAFMSRHQEACIALFAGAAGGSAAFSNDPKITDEQKALGGITAAAALLWALDHQEEVSNVSSELSKAAAQRANYAERITDLKGTITDVQAQIDALKPVPH
ncbi:MAG TPA: hypothetical protein VKT77_09600 [Chthonomonadaceae bacterium]|nr:hypothetical protein [Chthonomonadaceae bacterium]